MYNVRLQNDTLLHPLTHSPYTPLVPPYTLPLQPLVPPYTPLTLYLHSPYIPLTPPYPLNPLTPLTHYTLTFSRISR